jgi:hypothetical protein
MEDTKTAKNEDEGKQPVELPTTTKPAEVSAPPTEEARTAEPEGKLPEEVKERTRLEFEKLKEHNKQMAEELKALKGPQQPRRSALDAFAPNQIPGQVPQQVPFNPPFRTEMEVKPQSEEMKPIVPDENGLIDIDALNRRDQLYQQRLKKLEEVAFQATKKAENAEQRFAKYEHTDKTMKTYQKHPYLDPTGEQFDEKFSDLVRKELLDQMVNQGREDYTAAADKVKAEYYDPTNKPQAPVDEKAKENVTKRDQINALPGAGKGEKESLDQTHLVSESRRGDRSALYQRLKNSGY